MSRKKKLDASLEGLFSKSKKRLRPLKPVITEATSTEVAAAEPIVEEPVVDAAPTEPVVEEPVGDAAPAEPVVGGPVVDAITTPPDVGELQPEPSLDSGLTASLSPAKTLTFVPDEREAQNGLEEQLVIFSLADEYYGLDISDVEGIINMQAITTLPQAPAFVVGVTSLRGKVLPVVDLRKRFGLPQEGASKDTRIIVVDVAGANVGMVVDAVSEVMNVPVEAIEPPSSLVTTVDSDFIKGIAKVEERLVILLDLAKLLTAGELMELQAESNST